LSAAQQALLIALIETRVGLINDEDAAVKMKEIKANIADTYFAWSGAVAAGGGSYFRVTAPTLVLEFSPQSMGGDASNHIHSMYRDPTDDYGVNLYK
jgi:citrate lyase beta subunit